MISWVINSLRAFKGAHDVAFSEEQYYKDARQQIKAGFNEAVAAAKDGYANPAPPKRFLRKPFRILLCILLALWVLGVMFGGRF